ncbi:hypothetical protein MJO29_002279 [Puccinia striiformis f. sp. tritici]|nr:hypothetical protein MJO29_002279 [Puccinia striiformis f. sp. tritici]
MSQEISNPLPVDIQTHPSAEAANVSISPDVLMQIAQLLAAQKITIPALPSPVPSGSIKPPPSIDPLAASKPSTELLEGIFDEDDGMNEDDGMSLKSLDDLVPTKTTEGDLPVQPKQLTGPGEGDLITNLDDYDYEIGGKGVFISFIHLEFS